MSDDNGPRLLVALDYDNAESCRQFIQQLNPANCRLKIGKELFTSAGPAIVEIAQNAGFDVFLDLKFHDIPNTVAKAVKAAANLGVWMVNVHASGGRRMMEAAADAVAHAQRPPHLIAVTVLTSMDTADLAETGVSREPAQQVQHLAALAKQSGIQGVVCSAHEAAAMKQALGKGFVTVTPGIRPATAAADDQRRIMTPEQAAQSGSDYLVVGRPITQASDPTAVCEAIATAIHPYYS
ncbi:orotidine-5'-phosphate decarboxylase [Teredinibacter waterburyi]|uniref:orotidine-5'-phosphate decarboxylase n=1 Tax=Teredinibacter waterburyi TaxID=1500538 RepID=UPI00165FDA2B|nr:orotidine-5'-phosphate decarboxylase [Teredinibacter waterburyi]